MDVILINSIGFSEDNVVPQLGLMSLKNVLSTKYKVEIISFDKLNKTKKLPYFDKVDANIESFVSYLLELDCAIIGFYTICNTYPLSIELARRLKLRKKEISIIFGGPQASLTAEQTLKVYPFVDLVAMGEGEIYIMALIDQIKGEREYRKVPNIAYRASNGAIKKNKLQISISGAELSKYTVLNVVEYENLRNMDKKDFIQNIEAGRGCPFGCTFCSTSVFWGRNFRVKEIDSLISELEYFNSEYGIKRFRLEHDLFTANKAYVLEFCKKLIDKKLDITWGCSSRIDILDDDLMKALKSSGCNAIYIGFETGSKVMQKKLNKNIPVDSANLKLLRLHNYGFDLTVSFIFGFPEETEDDLKDTLRLLGFLYCNNIGKLQLHKFIPLPSTVETNKVMDRLIFDLTDVDISIYQKAHFDNKLYNIIKRNKQIHSCFYTFHSELRSKYKHLDVLITCFSLSFNMFKLSIKYLITNVGILNTYLDCKSLIEECYSKMQSLILTECFSDKTTNQLLFELFFIIAEYETKKLESPSFYEILHYERDLYCFTYQSNEVACCKEYYIDIFNAIKKYEIPEMDNEKYVIKFTRNNNRVSISKIKQEDFLKWININ